MMIRHQLPVASPVSLSGVIRSSATLITARDGVRRELRETLSHRFGAREIVLTDSGTSALVLALQMVAGKGGTVAFPAYVCVDLIAATRYADVSVRLYDIDPNTLSPDLDSVRVACLQGVDAIVVAHLYGFPADVPGVRGIAEEFGVAVIEDAAQQAGATLSKAPAGGLGDVSILSFGRGKGTTSGNGGALLALTERWAPRVEALGDVIPGPSRGSTDVFGAAATWMLGRPSIYGIPASIPGLHLGETVYHEAHQPVSMSRAAAVLLQSTIGTIDTHVAIRRKHAEVLSRAAEASARLNACQPIAEGRAGYLRFPIVTENIIDPQPKLGIVRGYPKPLFDYEEIQPCLLPSNELFWGARTLARGLLTLPTHHLLRESDLKQLSRWLRMA